MHPFMTYYISFFHIFKAIIFLNINKAVSMLKEIFCIGFDSVDLLKAET